MNTVEIVDILHAGRRGCGEIAFRYDHRPRRDERMMQIHATGLKGEQFICGVPLVCGNCKRDIQPVGDTEPVGGYAGEAAPAPEEPAPAAPVKRKRKAASKA